MVIDYLHNKHPKPGLNIYCVKTTINGMFATS